MKILILYYVATGSIKYKNWHDGFTKAVEILKKDTILKIDMINFFDDSKVELNNYNFVFIKWGFGSNMQIYAQNYFKEKGKKCKIGIMISSTKIPSDYDIHFFDILFYETEWYKKKANLNRHPYAYHAFGIDTDIMKKIKAEKIYDYIFVGNLTEYKRPLKLINKPGRKIAVGFLEDKQIVNQLNSNDIETIDFVDYSELAKLYNKSKTCYIPCTIDGGGERAVLEARSCEINVEIEKDNPKLLELTKSDIYDSMYYANQIKRGLFDVVNANIKNIIDVYKLYTESNLKIIQVGAMDGIKLDSLYPYIVNNKNIKAYLFEPVKYYFDKLVDNYKDADGHYILMNYAIGSVDGEINFYVIDPKQIADNNLPDFLMGISSTYNDRNSLSREYWASRGKIHTQKYGWTYENMIEKYIKNIKVKSIRAETFIKKYRIDAVDIMVIDAEGSDYNIIKDFLSFIRPKYIKFEYNNLPPNELEDCKNLLLANNYKTIFYSGQDCLAIYLY